MNLGRKLKELREEKGIEAQVIAKQINVAKSTYSGYESGRAFPNYNTLSELADIFNVTTDYLLGKSNAKSLNYTQFTMNSLENKLNDLIHRLDHSDTEKVIAFIEGLLAGKEGK